jgi:hypothetical protein
MVIGTMYMLLAVAAILFLISLIAYMTDNENIITLSCMMISVTMFWKLGNAYIDGTLTRIVGETGIVEVVREPVAASIFHWLAFVLFIGFIIQIIKVMKDSKVIEEY